MGIGLERINGIAEALQAEIREQYDEPEAVVQAVRKHKAPLVGLSALMTTTLKAMEETIALLRAENLACKVMVGGAVLTQDYAIRMGADFYARDAKQAVDVARRVFQG